MSTKKSAKVPQVLNPRVTADIDTLRTAQALQRHQEWVSQESDEIPELLAEVGFSLMGKVINPVSTGGQAYVATRGDDLVIAFRGSGGDDLSETARNVIADINAIRVRPKEILNDRKSKVRVHKGFYTNYLAFRDTVIKHVRAVPNAHVYVTGFSLGSALATVCAFDISVNENRRVTLHGAGTPRVGNRAFARLMAQQVPHTLRMVLTTDPVNRVPVQLEGSKTFHHVGDLMELHIDGAPVPLNEIERRLPEVPRVADHNRNKYASMIASFIDRFEAQPKLLMQVWGDNPLQNAADRERGLRLADLLGMDDDEEEDDE